MKELTKEAEFDLIEQIYAMLVQYILPISRAKSILFDVSTKLHNSAYVGQLSVNEHNSSAKSLNDSSL